MEVLFTDTDGDGDGVFGPTEEFVPLQDEARLLAGGEAGADGDFREGRDGAVLWELDPSSAVWIVDDEDDLPTDDAYRGR